MRNRFVITVLAIAATCLTIVMTLGIVGVPGSAKRERDSRSGDRTHSTSNRTDTNPRGAVNVVTYHYDLLRSGQNLQEEILTPANVNSNQFGKIGFLSVDGMVDAAPLYVSQLTVANQSHNVVFVVTEHDSVYAFDADTFDQLWHVSVLGSDETPSDDRNCGQVSPEIGITSTPVIQYEANNGIMYLVAMSKDHHGKYFQRLHALDIGRGFEMPGSPATIEARFPNLRGETVFDPKQYKERASLLLVDGVVYTSWASHCDIGDYTGWLIGYNASTLQQTNVLNLTPNGSDGAIWMSGAGPAADSGGNIYLLDANGTFDTALNSKRFPVSGDFGNAFLKLSVSGGNLRVADYFNMHDTSAESLRDEDLGSGGALVLPDLKDASGHTWRLAVGAGKDHRVYVVNRDSMGKFSTATDNSVYQHIDDALKGGVFGMPAYFKNMVYFGAVDDSLKAFSIVNARLLPRPISKTLTTFAYPGTTPSVSADDDLNGIVWAVEARGSESGVLHAYDAGDLSHELYNSNQAGARDAFSDNKYITPVVANGEVFVGTLTGVAVFGLLQ